MVCWAQRNPTETSKSFDELFRCGFKIKSMGGGRGTKRKAGDIVGGESIKKWRN